MRSFLIIVTLITALPGCSMFSGNKQSGQAMPPPNQYTQPAAKPVYDSSQNADTIRQVQSKLRDLNLYHGKIDGNWGPATQNALQTYQQRHSLHSTAGDGKLDDTTLASLGINVPNQTNPPADQNPQPGPNTPVNETH